MKKNNLSTTLGVGLLVLGLQANSQEAIGENPVDPVQYTYTCTGEDQTLLYVQNSENKGAVQTAQVKYGVAGALQQFEAILTQTFSPLYQVDNYELKNGDVKVGDLKVVTHQFIGRGGCGRAGCNNQIFQIQAQLKLGNDESTFDCH